jgi:hypothetical protein
MRKSRTKRFDPLVIPTLLEEAKAGKIESRDKLLEMFQSLAATLVHVCITGRVNQWSSYQISFLKYFSSKSTPIENTAEMLKKKLKHIEKTELFMMAQYAILKAIEECKTNLASTIVICFKEIIANEINTPTTEDQAPGFEVVYEVDDFEKVELEHWIYSLKHSEQVVVKKILDGKNVKSSSITPALQNKLRKYLGHN